MQQKVFVKSTCKIVNNHKGFEQLIVWIRKHHKQKEIALAIVMEATGIYFEHCAIVEVKISDYLSSNPVIITWQDFSYFFIKKVNSKINSPHCQ